MKKVISIIDYGLGNILSAKQSFLKVAEEHNLDTEVKITNDPKDILNTTHIVLPGQGAFKACMEGLSNISGMIDELSKAVLEKKTPFLGICIGMQLLSNLSYENGEHKGLGWIGGKIKKLPNKNLKMPHMGWNVVKTNHKNNLLINISNSIDFYFVHSYYFDCENLENQIGTTNYGINFTSIISKENIYGVQFHPEKSSKQGLKLIKNFLTL